MERVEIRHFHKYLGSIRDERINKQISIGHNLACEDGKHTQHLCYMVEQGFHINDEHYYQALTSEPNFKCQQCGRVAKKANNLCQPLRLLECTKKRLAETN
jgi:hypothetical protein